MKPDDRVRTIERWADEMRDDALLTLSDDELRREVLDRLVENKLLIAAAKEAEIRIEDETVQQDVEENVQELVKHFGSLAALEAELRRSA